MENNMTPKDKNIVTQLNELWQKTDRWDLMGDLASQLDDSELKKEWNDRAYMMYLKEEASSGMI